MRPRNRIPCVRSTNLRCCFLPRGTHGRRYPSKILHLNISRSACVFFRKGHQTDNHHFGGPRALRKSQAPNPLKALSPCEMFARKRVCNQTLEGDSLKFIRSHLPQMGSSKRVLPIWSSHIIRPPSQSIGILHLCLVRRKLRACLQVGRRTPCATSVGCFG